MRLRVEQRYHGRTGTGACVGDSPRPAPIDEHQVGAGSVQSQELRSLDSGYTSGGQIAGDAGNSNDA